MMTRVATALLLVLSVGCSDDDPHAHHNHGTDDTDAMNLTRMATTDGGTWMLSYVPSTDPIEVSENFTLTVSIDSGETEGTSLDFDAMMPAHGHGMNTDASVTDNGDGTYTVDGMLFHMPGHWRMMADVSNGDTTETATFDVEL